MSFGSGFGGFGSNSNNTNQNSGFGGFGSTNNSTAGGFGSNAGTGFGNNTTQNTGGSLFGAGGSGFGSGTSAFGASKPFGGTNTSSGGLFGNTTSTSTPSGTGFGGFGGNSNNAAAATTTTSGFGSGNTGGSLFGGGANKTSFGTGTTGGGGLFGASNTTGGFGANNTSTSSGLFANAQGTALGGNTPESQGTATPPFSPFIEKENNSSITNHYQAITCMPPYLKYSFDELRVADYNKGQRFGNANGQAGAFGANTGFGGFVSNNTPANTGFSGGSGTLFGTNTTSSSAGFGSNTATAGGFGGGLFGQNKPATGGLFGPPAASSSTATGGLFATTGASGFGNNTGSGLGSTSAGGTLFGQNQNQQKPGGFAFGGQQNNNNNTTSTNAAFGGGFGSSTNNTAGGLFGQNQNQQQTAGSGLFGQQPQQQNTASGLFGQQNQQQNSGFGGFGQNNQQKTGGLFGANPNNGAGGSLFNNQQNNQQQGGGLFGANNNNSNTGGLFGQKPAQTSGLFGANNNTNTGASLFNNNNNQQQQQNNAGGLFGNPGNPSSLFNKPANAGGIFGPNNQQPANSGLFGGSSNVNAGSLFSNNANNNASVMGSQPNVLQPPQGLNASIADLHPYGNASIFIGLPAPSPNAVGPVATPISSGQKPKKSAALPQYKINPAMSSRFATPQKRGYGFSYSTYGTPSSISSAASTPGGLSSSLLGGSLSRSLGKSFSTSNLRRTFDSDADSILTPGAFSANSSRYGNGSLKKLNIDRSLRTDLFGDALAALPAPERIETSRSPSIKKKVSFDASTTGGSGKADGDVDEYGFVDASESTAQETATPRSRQMNGANGARTNGTSPEKNNQLMTVHEDGSPQADNTNALIVRDQADPDLGEYWSEPSIADLKKMPREKLKHVENFQVGRFHAGSVTFEQPVDLTSLNLDDIFDKIVVIVLRSLTVYPANVSKPPLGKGLNVPSVVTLENSWPKQRDKKTPSMERSGPRFEKHVRRLAAVRDTTFVNYNPDTGEWTFKVPHFTTYELDYDDDDTTEHSEMEGLASSTLSEAKSLPTPSPARAQPSSSTARQDSTFVEQDAREQSSEPDDTFAFKTQRIFPGAFDDDMILGNQPAMSEIQRDGQSFLGVRSAVPHSEDEDDQDEPSEPQALVAEDHSLVIADDLEEEDDMDMAGSFPAPEQGYDSFSPSRLPPYRGTDGTPSKALIDFDMDWMQQLQRTVSPKKQDRQALRLDQDLLFTEHGNGKSFKATKKSGIAGGEITTSIDLMNSLFGKEEVRRRQGTKQVTGQKGMKWPYQKKPESSQRTMSESDRAFHDSFKPSWSARQRLTYLVTNDSYAARDIRTMKFARTRDINATNFQRQQDQTTITLEDGVPLAKANLASFASNKEAAESAQAHNYECLAWELASILFDDYEDDISSGLSDAQLAQFETRIRKDRLAAFWSTVCEEEANRAVASADTAEERAIAYLSAHKIASACNALVEGKDFRLATLVAQIGGNRTLQEDMESQIEEWHKLKVLSEMTDSSRALYELLAGNTCTSLGKHGAVEDRAQNLLIPSRFGMDWKRAFGLKLWYGVLDSAPVEDAISAYAKDLGFTELQRPLPFFLASDTGADLPWTDPRPATREDILWGILRLYAERASTEHADPAGLAGVLRPENAVGLPFSFRLTFEAYRALAPHFPHHSSPLAFDEICVSFAAELEAVDQWLWAVFALLHLSHARQRRAAVQDVLSRNARALNAHDAKLWGTLVDEWKVPANWLWDAKALYVQASPRSDPALELEYLLRARNGEEAHRKLVEAVGPLKVVAREHQSLMELLTGFELQEKPKGWAEGGGLYVDYLNLISGAVQGKERKQLVNSLMRRLAAAKKAEKKSSNKGSRDHDSDFLRSVALREISGVVGDAALEDEEHGAKEQAYILQLPLAAETRRTKATGLAWEYYQSVMAGGR